MERFKVLVKRIFVGLPVAGIVGASFFPLHALGHQFLVLITLLWFMTYILFDAFVR
jgi:hypothetical protein